MLLNFRFQRTKQGWQMWGWRRVVFIYWPDKSRGSPLGWSHSVSQFLPHNRRSPSPTDLVTDKIFVHKKKCNESFGNDGTMWVRDGAAKTSSNSIRVWNTMCWKKCWSAYVGQIEGRPTQKVATEILAGTKTRRPPAVTLSSGIRCTTAKT